MAKVVAPNKQTNIYCWLTQLEYEKLSEGESLRIYVLESVYSSTLNKDTLNYHTYMRLIVGFGRRERQITTKEGRLRQEVCRRRKKITMDNLYTGDSRRATRNKAKRREELIDVILIHSKPMWFGLDMMIVWMTLLFPPTHHDIKRYDEFKNEYGKCGFNCYPSTLSPIRVLRQMTLGLSCCPVIYFEQFALSEGGL